MSSQGSQSSSTRKPSRGVGGRLGRGRSTGGRRGSGGATKGNRPNSSAKRSTSREARTQSNNAIAPIKSASTNSSDTANCMPSMRDEEVLIAFMPFLKGDNQEAMSIHEIYQADNDQQAFLRSAREFLWREQQSPNHCNSSAGCSPTNDATQCLRAKSISPVSLQVERQLNQPASNFSPSCYSINDGMDSSLPPHVEGLQLDVSYEPTPAATSILSLARGQLLPPISRAVPSPPPAQLSQVIPLDDMLQSEPVFRECDGTDRSSPNMESMERKFFSLLSDDDDPVVAMPTAIYNVSGAGTIGTVGSSPARPVTNIGDAGSILSSLSSPSPQGNKSGQHFRPAHLPQLHQQSSFAPHNFTRQTLQQHHPGITHARGPPGLPLSMLHQTLETSPTSSQYAASFLPRSLNLGNGSGGIPPPTSAVFQHFTQLEVSNPTTLQSKQRQPGMPSLPGARRHWRTIAPTSGMRLPPSSQKSTQNTQESVSISIQSHPQEVARMQLEPPRHQDAKRKNDQLGEQTTTNKTPSNKPMEASSALEPGNVIYSTGSQVTDAIGTNNANAAVPTATSAKKEYQPKRLWTRFEEQPGRIMANGVPASDGSVLDLRPRQELTAKWMLPISYLRRRSAEKQNVKTIRDALSHLAVGLFRRGCTENGAHASIISKEVCLAPLENDSGHSGSGSRSSDYPFQILNDTVVGTVPFYSPRTPGHVVFRLYWQDDPLTTLATGPTLNVRVTEDDFESSIRFILSNFKAKKVNPTSLSSLNSLVLVLEQFQLPGLVPNASDSHHQQQLAQQVPQHLEGAGRAVWGCICEARKVLDACATEHLKTSGKLQKLEEAVEELKAKVEDELGNVAAEGEPQDQQPWVHQQQEREPESGGEQHQQELLPSVVALREKQKALMSGRASCERKWRDSQLAFASILKAVVTNTSISLLLRRDLVNKLRLEFELWCPLCEEFAVPTTGEVADFKVMWYEPLMNLGHSITADDFRICKEARSKMQIRILGFQPNTMTLSSIVYPQSRRAQGASNCTPQMSPTAVAVLNQLSSAMGQLYQDLYTTADRIHRQREYIRSQMEEFVSMCDDIPQGTKVVVFGSAANGFGSPKSDLDMCLQLPEGSSADREDPTGSQAMAKLAQILEDNGMKEVDTGRLTARIPVVKFKFPKPMTNTVFDGEDALIECDLSMHNPLAVLNTSLLRTYAEVNPVTRVLAAIIKRWAKARDINNPARHTLSSYGYILMLLHFLTFHERSGNGLVSPISGPEGNPAGHQQHPRSAPLLPNLQWMDSKWPNSTAGTSYRELQVQPKNLIPHPLEEKSTVNTYFLHINGQAELSNLQRLFPGQDLSLAILLASFFRYYAYEFDYKRHVVSLHSTYSRGLVEREAKAELDGWRNYSAALTIEDPFETFYDVAHVLRGGYYHRIRREFAVAYSKIADVAAGMPDTSWTHGIGGKQIDLSELTGKTLIDWICEPVANEREES